MRLLCVSRSFWPLASPGAVLLRDRLAALARLGVRVTVLAARWDAGWSEETVVDGILVRRLGEPTGGRPSHDRHDRVLAERLRAEARNHDAILAVGAGRDGDVALRVEPDVRTPIVLCFDRPGPLGDGAPHGRWRLARRKRERSERVAKALASNALSYREALAAGLDEPRVRMIPFAAGAPSADLSAAGDAAARRAAARDALADGHPHLRLGPAGKVVAYLGPLHEPHRIAELVRLAAREMDRTPSLRVWIAGEGPYAAQIRRAADRYGIADSVALLGEFDAWDDLVAAADVVVVPSSAEPFSIAAVTAARNGTPAIVATSEAYEALGDGVVRLDPNDEAAWTKALSQALDQPPRAPAILVPSHDDVAPAILRQLATLPSPIRLG